MALHKEIQSKIGIPLNYWRIKSFSFDNIDKKGHIILVPYVSKTARDSGNDYLREESRKISIYNLDYSDKPGYESKTAMRYNQYFEPKEGLAEQDIYAVMYRYIKENEPDFRNAEDV